MQSGQVAPFYFPALTARIKCPAFVRTEWLQLRQILTSPPDWVDLAEGASETVAVAVLGDPEPQFYLPPQEHGPLAPLSVSSLFQNLPTSPEALAAELERQVKDHRKVRGRLKATWPSIALDYVHPLEYVQFHWQARLWPLLEWLRPRRHDPRFEVRQYALVIEEIVRRRWPTVHAAWLDWVDGVSLTRPEAAEVRKLLDNKMLSPTVHEKFFPPRREP